MKAFFFFLLSISPLYSFSQTLLGTSGGTLSDTQNQFDFSIGEAIVAEVSGNGFTNNIGFQQPYYDFFTGLKALKVSAYQLFPNPFATSFRFEGSSEIDQSILLDALGKEAATIPVHGIGFEYSKADLPKGMYNLRIQMLNKEIKNLKLVHQ